tara:strand:- start:6053 stop:6397 length:345 start_codon:yes stop_codon:yes gene_type:complete
VEDLGGLGGLSAAGIFILIILREVFAFLKAKDGDKPAPLPPSTDPECAREIEEQVRLIREAQARTAAYCEKMSEVLSAKDAEGLPLVYTPRSLGKSIESLSISITRLADDVRGQ